MLILLEFLFFIDLLLVKKLLLNKIFKIRYHSKENIERALIKNMNNINLYIINGCNEKQLFKISKKSNMANKHWLLWLPKNLFLGEKNFMVISEYIYIHFEPPNSLSKCKLIKI